MSTDNLVRLAAFSVTSYSNLYPNIYPNICWYEDIFIEDI